jgi:hypothetical protein
MSILDRMGDIIRGIFDIRGHFDFIREMLTGSNVANAAILNVYRDSLLDNSIQPCSEDPAIQDRVKELREELKNRDIPLRLGELYSIEAELWNYFTDSTVLARFWAVRDRFSRVASAESQAKYDHPYRRSHHIGRTGPSLFSGNARQFAPRLSPRRFGRSKGDRKGRGRGCARLRREYGLWQIGSSSDCPC